MSELAIIDRAAAEALTREALVAEEAFQGIVAEMAIAVPAEVQNEVSLTLTAKGEVGGDYGLRQARR